MSDIIRVIVFHGRPDGGFIENLPSKKKNFIEQSRVARER